ncbi:MAG: CBS domain-containing protein [Anaerolineaceae bacterium]|nr:CBS domain-containing protein [Anaerolineaceae bacterium]
MKVENIMTRNPVTIHPDSTLREAIEKMERSECHHLPVISAAGHLVGIITARDCRLALRLPDIVQKYWKDHATINHLTVSTVMSVAPIVVEPDTPVAEAARLMLANYVSSLPVMLGETLVGIVTISDVLVAFVKMNQATLNEKSSSE